MASEETNDIEGRAVIEGHLSFYASALSVDKWKAVIDHVGIQGGESDQGISGQFIAFADPFVENSHYIVGHVHSHPDGEKMHWILNWDLAPSAPPQSLLDVSRLVGGTGEVLGRIEAVWPGVENEFQIEYSVTFELDKRIYKLFRSRPRGFDVETSAGVTRLRTYYVSWDLDPSAGTIANIQVRFHRRRRQPILITAAGEVSASFSSSILQEVQDIAWQDLEPFIQDVRGD